MNKWVKLGVMGITMLGLAGCAPKKIALNDKYTYTAYDGHDYGYNGDMKANIKGTTSSNTAVKIHSNTTKEAYETKSDSKGDFKIALPVEGKTYTFTAKNKYGKSKPTKFVIKKEPKKLDVGLKVDGVKDSDIDSLNITPNDNGKKSIRGLAKSGTKISASDKYGMDVHTIAKEGRFELVLTGLYHEEEFEIVATKHGLKEDAVDVYTEGVSNDTYSNGVNKQALDDAVDTILGEDTNYTY